MMEHKPTKEEIIRDLREYSEWKHKHHPSGIYIVWLGKDGRPHSKSIGIATPNPEFARKWTGANARTELLLKQLDYMAGEISSPPMVVTGLTRKEAKLALLKEPLPTEVELR